MKRTDLTSVARSIPHTPPVRRSEERRLIRQARSGDRRALSELARRISGSLYRFGRGFCRDPHDAEDVMQDVLATLVRSLDGFRGDSTLSSWAYVVARNACARRRRGAGRVRPIESDEGRHVLERPDPAGPADRETERRELREALVAAIGELPDAQRDVIMLRDVEGLPGARVAALLGIDERAMKSRLHRARLALRLRLAPHVTPGAPPRGPRCPDTARMLSRFLEQELDAAVCARLEAHVLDCPSCGAACESLRQAIGACRSWGRAPVPAGELARIRSAIRRAITEIGAA
jgi:RNA polymerase sigma-70 factor (ECF subfamily)